LVEGGADLHPLGPAWHLEALVDLAQRPGITLGMAFFLDGTNIRAHQKAAGAKKGDATVRSEMCARCSAVLVEATAKVCVIVDGCGRAVAFELAPGQAHKLPMAPGPLDCLPDVPGWVVGDSGLASDAFREPIWDLRVSNKSA
jgi:hypothetical protein